MYFIGIDIGTTSVKLLAIDDRGSVVQSAVRDYPISFPRALWSEQNPEDWWNRTIDGLKELIAGLNKDEIKAVSFSGQMHGLVVLDETDQVIRPAILWNDQRTEKECKYLNEEIGQNKISDWTGNLALTGFTAPKVLWLGENEPENFARIKKILCCSDDELHAAQHLIVGLNPKPGAEFDRSVADYVVPDVIVERHKNKWCVRLNAEAMPKLRVNQIYANILQQRNDKNSSQLAAQLQEAKWLIKNLQQRFETILRVARAIVDRQGNFFEHGEIGMRPLVLREIADALELHKSTVSRSTTQKFMLTPRGIYEFKHFFGSGLSTESGGTCSSTAIRELIKQLVSAEDTRKPLTDSRMSEILAQQGIIVARRTIAKYREALHIPPVNLRKSL